MPSRAEAAALAWLLAVLGMAVHALLWWREGAALDTSILAMLPQDAGTAREERARDQVLARGERRLLLLVGHTDAAIAGAAADEAARALRGAPLDCEASAAEQDPLRVLAGRDALLLDAQTRAELGETPSTELARRALARLYTPLPDVSGLGAANDPFALRARWLQAQAARFRLQPRDGRLVAEQEGRTWVALPCATRGSPFERGIQQRVADAVGTARAAAAASGAELLAAGVVLHAHAAAATAQAEFSTIGSGSLVGIALLVIAVFGSLRMVFVLQLPVLVGALAGLSACLAVFGQLHALTVVFGASLLGVAVDYPIHYASHVPPGAGRTVRMRTLRELLPGLTIALLTTIAAYVALAIPPFPGLRQMALFAGAGLTAAWFTVVCWCPWLVSGGVRRHAPAVRALLRAQAVIASWPERRRFAAVALLCVAVFPGLQALRVNDDLRMLQNSPSGLLEDQARVARIAGLASPAQYFLVSGPDAASVLEREEILGAGLQRAVGAGALQGYQALSQWVPSPARQAQDRALLLERLYAPGAALEQLAQAAGFDRDRVDAQRARFGNAQPLALGDWLDEPAAQALRAQWLGCEGGSCASVVLLEGISGAAGLAALAALAQPEQGIAWVDTVARTSALLARYRAGMMDVLGIAVGATFVLLWIRHRGGALRAIAPPLVAAYLTLALFGWTGIEINLFAVLAFVLVLGMGVDYGIYLAEPLDQELSGVGVALDVLTTILGFGLLALSSTPALHLFGLTLAVAVSLAWLLAGLTGLRAPTQGATTTAIAEGGRDAGRTQ